MNPIVPSFIRFVGGPLHNRHLCIPWCRYFSVPVEADPSKLPWNFEPEDGPLLPPQKFVVVDYELRILTTHRGAVFYEFHCCGVPAHLTEQCGSGSWLKPREV